MPQHLYIDCTETLRLGAATGIQRTVRSIVQAGRDLAAPAFVPVVFDGGSFVAADRRELDAASGARPARLRERLRRAILAGSRSAALRASILHPAVQSVARRGASAGYWAMRSRRARYAPQVSYARGDWLVLLDSTWGPDLRAELARAKRDGARVCAVVYDLIQVRRPELVSPGAARLFAGWLARTLPFADRILTISASVQGDLVTYLAEHGMSDAAVRVDWFHLGSDFAPPTAPPAAEVAAMLADDPAPAFLAVGTLEPRKAQATLLDAFEKLWARGNPSRLVLVGREGFGSHALVARIARHAELGRRLFWLSEASDADLAHCYRNVAAVLNASLCEGFGLPIVEAAHFGAPVLASDIGVFREVGGDAVTYVAPGDADAWAQAVEAAGGRRPAVAATACRSWRTAAETLAAKLA